MKKLILIQSLVCFMSFGLFATNYYVSLSGNNTTGLSPANAFLTIQQATNIVVAGDCVLVANGAYGSFDHSNLNSGTTLKPIVYKAIGKNVKITTGNAHGHNAINVENNDCIHIIGFIASGMYTLYGDPAGANAAGVRIINSNHSLVKNMICDSDIYGVLTGYCNYLTIEHNTCKYDGGSAARGQHGIYHSNGGDYATIQYNVCTDNFGAGIQFNPDFSAQDQPNDGLNTGSNCSFNVIARNHIGLNTQGLDGAIISNNLIYENASNAITFYHAESSGGTTNSKVFNNTIVHNAAGRWCIFLQNEVTNLQIYNNILINNVSGTLGSICFFADGGTKTFTSDYNVVVNKFCNVDDGCGNSLASWQGLGYDAHSILAPALASLFVNPSAGDYHLLSGSVAVNAGTSLVSGTVSMDMDNMVRPAGGAYDIGCYEYGSTPAGLALIYSTKNIDLVVTPGLVYVNDLQQTDQVLFMDMTGRIVYNGKYWNSTEASAGIYICIVLDKTGAALGNKKFALVH